MTRPAGEAFFPLGLSKAAALLAVLAYVLTSSWAPALAQQDDVYPPLIPGSVPQTDDEQEIDQNTQDDDVQITDAEDSDQVDLPDEPDTRARDLALGAAAVLLGLAVASQAAQAQEQARDTVAFFPLPRVVAINATLHAVDGRLSYATASSARFVNSYAPKSFAQDSGEWQVLVYGSGRGYDDPPGQERSERARRLPLNRLENVVRRYRVRNPLNGIEQETAPDSETLFEPVRYTGAYDWQIVVPLYDGDTVYDIDAIRIVDRQTNQEIVSLDFRGGDFN